MCIRDRLDPDEVGAAGVDALLTDLTFSAAGDLVLLLDQGTVAPLSLIHI